jgi:hypothetical protein
MLLKHGTPDIKAIVRALIVIKVDRAFCFLMRVSKANRKPSRGCPAYLNGRIYHFVLSKLCPEGVGFLEPILEHLDKKASCVESF